MRASACWIPMLLGTAATLAGVPAPGQSLWHVDGSVLPGIVWRSAPGASAQVLHYRLAIPDRAYPRAVMKAAQVAVDPEGKVFFCSGLDGYVIQLLDGRNEILPFPEVVGPAGSAQVRDVACSSEPHTVYYSVVATPQDGEPLADGVIYRRDLWEGAPSVFATVRQADVGGNWWGLFAVREGEVYLATTEPTSRMLKLEGGAARPLATLEGKRVSGLTAAPGGEFYVVWSEGGSRSTAVHTTRDFQAFEPVEGSPHGASDVAVR